MSLDVVVFDVVVFDVVVFDVVIFDVVHHLLSMSCWAGVCSDASTNIVFAVCRMCMHVCLDSVECLPIVAGTHARCLCDFCG